MSSVLDNIRKFVSTTGGSRKQSNVKCFTRANKSGGKYTTCFNEKSGNQYRKGSEVGARRSKRLRKLKPIKIKKRRTKRKGMTVTRSDGTVINLKMRKSKKNTKVGTMTR